MAMAVAMRTGCPAKRPLAKEVAGAQHRHDRFLAGVGEDPELHAALLNVDDAIAGVTLRVDDLSAVGARRPSRLRHPTRETPECRTVVGRGPDLVVALAHVVPRTYSDLRPCARDASGDVRDGRTLIGQCSSIPADFSAFWRTRVIEHTTGKGRPLLRPPQSCKTTVRSEPLIASPWSRLDEPELPELAHEEVHARPGDPGHFSERPLRDSRHHPLRLARLAVARQQQQGPSQSLAPHRRTAGRSGPLGYPSSW